MHWLIINPFFINQYKDKQEAYEKLVEMSRNNDCRTGIFIDYLYHPNYYKLIVIDSSWQAKTSITHKLICRKIRKSDGTTMFFIPKKQRKNYYILFFRFNNFNRIIWWCSMKKKLNLFKEAIRNDSKFLTRKWNIINDKSNANFSVGDEIIYNTEF